MIDRLFVAGARWSGSRSFILTCLVFTAGWIGSGSYFQYSEGWQFALNQPATIVTLFLGAFIQFDALRFASVQKARDAAMHAKLDELIHALRGARDDLRGIERLPPEALQAVLSEEVKETE